MFSSITSFTEGIKRLSLDTLQDEEEHRQNEKAQVRHQEDGTTHGSSASPTSHTATLTTIPEQPASTMDIVVNGGDEWEWDDEHSTADRKRVARRIQKQLPDSMAGSPSVGAALIPGGTSVPISFASGTTPLAAKTAAAPRVDGAVIKPASFGVDSNIMSGNGAFPGPTDPVAEPLQNIGREGRRDGDSEQVDRDVPYSDTVMHAPKRYSEGGALLSDPSSSEEASPDAVTSSLGGEPNLHREASAANGASDSATCNTIISAVVASDDGERGEKTNSVDGLAGTRAEDRELPARAVVQNSTESTHEPNPASDNLEPSGTSEAAAEALAEARNELATAKGLVSTLEKALDESRSEINALREEVVRSKSAADQQARDMVLLRDDVEATRMGYRESNEAHQRTAERVSELRRELLLAREATENLKAEKSALLGQLNMAMEGRQELEAQLRQLHAGLTEGQEAARNEGRKEAERLEARVKELLKDRDRKQAELDLQNARRKETREMARDLESQLAAVERIAQEREVELNKLKEDSVTLKRQAAEAKEKEATWATKHEALDRNFRQVRAQGRNVDSEVEQLRRDIARLEAENAALTERVEEEGAERVTVVSSISHERDFLLRQVDRLEKEVADLRRKQATQVAEAGTRAQTTVALEEYRTRAQQALKRANEVTSLTAAENKRLEAELSKLSSEVARERPEWAKSKELEQIRQKDLDKLEEELVNTATDRDSVAAAVAGLQERLAREEEERRTTHASVMRLEAQGKSLKQELQRQQKALAAAQERESVLTARLSEKDVALQASENCRNQITAPLPGETKVEKRSYTPNPGQADSSPQLGSVNEEKPERKGTGGEAPEVAGKQDGLESMQHSFRSLSSDGESVDVSASSLAGQLVYVHQLRERMSKDQVEMRSLISELEASRAARDAQEKLQAQLEKQLEAALLANTRLQELDQGRNAAVNLEYLKNCVVGCLRTSEPSEHARLLPVITTILKLSKDEADVIAKNISTRAHNQGSFGGALTPPGKERGWWSGKMPKR